MSLGSGGTSGEDVLSDAFYPLYRVLFDEERGFAADLAEGRTIRGGDVVVRWSTGTDRLKVESA